MESIELNAMMNQQADTREVVSITVDGVTYPLDPPITFEVDQSIDSAMFLDEVNQRLEQLSATGTSITTPLGISAFGKSLEEHRCPLCTELHEPYEDPLACVLGLG